MKTKTNVSDVFNVPLHKNDISALLEILDFSLKAASVLAKQELVKGAGVQAAQQMSQIAAESQELYQYFSKHLNIGEPTDGQAH